MARRAVGADAAADGADHAAAATVYLSDDAADAADDADATTAETDDAADAAHSALSQDATKCEAAAHPIVPAQ